MIGLDGLCTRLGIDADAAGRALEAPHEDEHVWYVQLVLGIGAWITALAGLIFVGILFEEVLLIGESGLAMSVIGVILFGLACAFLQRGRRGEFTTQMAVAAATCGAGLGVFGIAFAAESALLASIASVPFAVAAIILGRSALLQFLLSGLVIATIEILVIDKAEGMLVSVVALSLPAGLALFLWPARRNLMPTATALLLTMPLTVIGIYYAEFGIVGTPYWLSQLPARVICTISLAALIGIGAGLVAPGQGGVRGPLRVRPDQLLMLVLAIVAGIFLPAGLSATLAIMALGHTLGRRSLAIIGALLFAWFLWTFYADLHQTLLVKSIILIVAGSALLVIRWILGREPERAARAS